MNKPKFVFFGTPAFAAIILNKLIKAGWLPALVVCNPDKPVGRKKIITPPLTKILAQQYNIKVLQPENLVNFEIQNLKFEFFIVAAYNKIIPKEILDIPSFGAIGVHPSLLPKYRGPTPIQNVILNNEAQTGITLFLLDEKIDHGPIIAKSKFQILNSRITYEALNEKLAEIGGDLLIETLPKFLKGEITPQPQNENEATYTRKFTTEDGYVDLVKDDPLIIERKIRALNPEPGVWTMICPSIFTSPQDVNINLSSCNDDRLKKRMKILEAVIIDNKLKLKKIQFESQKPKFLI